jgi:NitT/TauT family transport system permease protein
VKSGASARSWQTLRAIVFAILPGFIALVMWQLFVRGEQRREFLFASPALILGVAVDDLISGDILVDLAITALEAISGLLFGSILGSLVGLLLWADERVARIARPYIVVLGAVPIFAIAPMLIIWFGTGLLSKVVMSAFSVFFVALSQAYDGAQFCSDRYTHHARTLAATHRRVLLKIILPGAFRWVAAGFKISIGLALVGAFIGEFVSSEAGLGHYILSAGSLYDMPRVLFGVILISSLALLLTSLVWLSERLRPALFKVGS